MASQRQPQNPKEHLQQMNILYAALMGGQVMICTLLYFFVGTTNEQQDSVFSTLGDLDPIVFIGIAVFIAAASVSFFLYNKRKEEGRQLTGSLMQKLDHYKKSFVLRAALLEGPNLTMIIFYFFVKQNIIFMLLFAVGFGLFVLIKPSAAKIIQDYQLSDSEQSELRNSTL